MLIRYLRLYAYFLRFSFSTAMEFRLDFFFRIVMDVLFYAVNIAFYQIIYTHTSTLGGWTLDQAMVFVAAYLVVDAVHMTAFANNLWHLAYFIRKGDLDYHLVRPVSPMFMLSLRDFAANSFMNLLIAAGFLVYALSQTSIELSPWRVFLFILYILNGAFLFYLIHLAMIIPTFWLHSGNGISALFYHLRGFMERPDTIFRGTMRILLSTLLPFSLMASIPTRALTDGQPMTIFLHILIVSCLLFFLVRSLFCLGLRHYSSASS